MNEQNVALIAPLLLQQDYIKSVAVHHGEPIDYDFDAFRDGLLHDDKPYGSLLAELQLGLFDVPVDEAGDAWLKLKPQWERPTKDPRIKVVINRTPRYHNGNFPWKRVVQEYSKVAVFIGLREEHAAFSEEFGEIPFYQTKDFLEAAQLIAGSQLFIGNQSCCCAIAEGLKHNLIQETYIPRPDSMYRRPNARHVAGTYLELPVL